MDELDLFGFIPNGGRIYCALSHLLFLYYLSIELILVRLGPVPATLVHPGTSSLFQAGSTSPQLSISF
jgi:hypothetical protein